MRQLIAITAALSPSLAAAHGAGLSGGTPEPWIVLAIFLTAVAYGTGLVRIWRRSGRGRGISVIQASSFWAGWLALIAVLSPPLERVASQSFSVHMLQHELLMLVVAPLLVAGRPLAVFAWALPRRLRLHVAPVLATRWLRVGWLCLTAPLVATLLQLVALWVWHAPRLFDAAVESRDIHALQHITFLATALCFWWATRATTPENSARSSPYLFVTMIGSGALGALLAFSGEPWYAAYGGSTSPYGWSPLEEQQVGGLLMWIPGGTVYMGAALWGLHRWLNAGTRPGRRTGFA